MANQLDIFNLALFKLGQAVGTVPNINDESKAADVLKSLWEPMRDIVLSDRVWPWSLRLQALAVVDDEDPQPGWGYRYALPNDCLTAVALTDENGMRQIRSMSVFANAAMMRNYGRWLYDWELAYGLTGTVINTDTVNALLAYVVRVEDAGRYPAHFVNALALRLAAEAAPPLIGDVGLNAQPKLMDA